MSLSLRDGSATEDRRLDRLVHFDPRSRNFQIRPLLDEVKAARRWWQGARGWQPSRPGLNQQAEGACTWFMTAHGLNSSPNRRKPPITEAEARRYYRRAQAIDPFPETFEGGEEGCTTVAAVQIAQQEGFVGEYRWIGAGSGTPVEDVRDTLRDVGGIGFGTPWFNSMFRPRPSGLLEVDPSAGLGGYHAIWGLTWRNAPIKGEGPKKVEHVVLQQSWGADHGIKYFGVGGHVLVRLEDLGDHLLPNNGEGVVFVER